jgi:hypothetical protein
MNLNREAFQKVHEVISAQPDRLVMSSWEDDEAPESCGTTRCVAGWAIHFAVGGAPLFDNEGGPSDEVESLAREHGLDPDDYCTSTLFEWLGANLLGLPIREARTVFYLSSDTAGELVRLAAAGDDAGFEYLLNEYL